MFLHSGAQPADCESPWTTIAPPNTSRALLTPIVQAAAMAPSMPTVTTTRGPNRSAHIPHRNWPTA